MIEIKLDTRQADDLLRRLAQRAADLSPAMRDVAQQLESDAREAFRSQGQPGGARCNP